MTPILYDSSEQNFTSMGLGALGDAISCTVYTVLNGLFELEMTYPISGLRYKELQISRIIKAVSEKGGTPQLFDIYAITKPISGVVTVYASHVSGRKQFIPIMPCLATGIVDALNVIPTKAAESFPFTFWTNKTTAGNFILKHPASLGQVLGGMEGSLLDVYRGEYEFDNFTIKIWNRRGQDNGVTLRYGKNITSIEQEESIASTITGICPFWADFEGNTVVLSEKTVDSPNASNFPFKRTVVKDFSLAFDNEPTEAQLKAYTEAYILANNIGVPEVGIDISYENLADYEEYAGMQLLEQIRLGDTVHVYFEPLDITAEARAVETRYDVLSGKYIKIRIGSVKANLSKTINNITNETNEAISQSAANTSTALEDAFKAALELFAGVDGGNIYYRTNSVTGKPYEILFMDTDNMQTAQKIVRANYAGFAVSKTGMNGPWTVAVTGDGVVADSITTGTLNANLIKAGILQSQEAAPGQEPNFYLDLIQGVLKGKFSQLTIQGQSVDDIAEDVLDDFIDNQYADDLATLQAQIDGQIETYFDDYVPTLNNEPAVSWTTTAAKDAHLGDLFYVVDDPDHGGECYRFAKIEGVYSWQLVQDSEVARAIQIAQDAYALAGTKKRVFTAQPTPPYEVGDLWVQGSLGDILVCVVARSTGSFSQSDWAKASKYTDDSALTTFISGAYAQDLAAIGSQIDQKAETWYQATDPSTDWTTASLQAEHEGDLWYDTVNQQYFRWDGDSWEEMTATPPDDVFDLIDGKANIFVSQPVPPYSVGDLWTDGSDLYKCINARSSGSFVASDWALATNYIDAGDAADVADSAISDYDTLLNQQAVFNKLTNNQANQGIYLENGQLYINASMIAAGILQGIQVIATTGNIGGWEISNEGLTKEVASSASGTAYLKIVRTDNNNLWSALSADGIAVERLYLPTNHYWLLNVRGNDVRFTDLSTQESAVFTLNGLNFNDANSIRVGGMSRTDWGVGHTQVTKNNITWDVMTIGRVRVCRVKLVKVVTVNNVWGNIYNGSAAHSDANFPSLEYPYTFTDEPVCLATIAADSSQDGWLTTSIDFSPATHENRCKYSPAYDVARGTAGYPMIAVNYLVIGTV